MDENKMNENLTNENVTEEKPEKVKNYTALYWLRQNREPVRRGLKCLLQAITLSCCYALVKDAVIIRILYGKGDGWALFGGFVLLLAWLLINEFLPGWVYDKLLDRSWDGLPGAPTKTNDRH